MKSKRRVAITGLGLVTPVGNDVPTVWNNLVAGKSGLGEIRGFDASGFSTRIGAEVKNYQPETLIHDRKLLKLASRSHAFALGAAEQAFRDAGIRPDDSTAFRWGLSIGAGMMGINFEELQTVHRFCGAEGEFRPEHLIDAE